MAERRGEPCLLSMAEMAFGTKGAHVGITMTGRAFHRSGANGRFGAVANHAIGPIVCPFQRELTKLMEAPFEGKGLGGVTPFT